MTVENKSTIDYQFLEQNMNRPFNSRVVLVAFNNLINNIGPVLKKYDIIVGDDSGGRLPTLVIYDLTKRKRKQLGLPIPSVFFVGGGRHLHKEEDAIEILAPLDKYLTKIKGEKVLIVSEYTKTGISIRRLSDKFESHGVRPDICILSVSSDLEQIRKNCRGGFYYGTEYGNAGIVFYTYSHLSGVSKVTGSLISKKFNLTDEMRKDAIQARYDMRVLADELWKLIQF